MKPFVLVAALVAALTTQALADAKADVANAFIAFAKLTSYHVTMNGMGKTADIDIVNPGKVHAVLGSMEMIKIDTTTYVKMNGTWRAFSFPGVDRFLAPVGRVQSLAQHPDDVVVTDLGSKTVEGLTYHAYSVKSASSTAGSTVYLDAAGNVARLETSDATLTFSKFNAPITISAPV